MDSEALLKRVKEVLSDIIDVERVYLFGSRARGTFHADSDIDLAIISSTFEEMSQRERYELVIDDVRAVVGDTPVDVVCYTPEEFQRGRDAFLPGIIAEEGISA